MHVRNYEPCVETCVFSVELVVLEEIKIFQSKAALLIRFLDS